MVALVVQNMRYCAMSLRLYDLVDPIADELLICDSHACKVRQPTASNARLWCLMTLSALRRHWRTSGGSGRNCLGPEDARRALPGRRPPVR